MSFFTSELGDLLTNHQQYSAPLALQGYHSDELFSMLNSMLTIRLVEQRIAQLVESGEVKCPCHLGVGQEAIAAGIAPLLHPSDKVFGTHRAHAQYLALGGSVHSLFAEVLGRETGCSKGMGGSMHLYAEDKGFAGSVPIVGGTVPVAVGAALALQKAGKGEVAACFFGDGTCEEGGVHESLNLAANQQLPILFVAENNLFSSHLDIHLRQPSDRLARFAEAHHINAITVDGNDVTAVNAAAEKLITAARAGEGPGFLEVVTYRWLGHVGPKEDIDVGLKRKAEDLLIWKKRDPISRLVTAMLAQETLNDKSFKELTQRTEQFIAAELEQAQQDPFPDKEKTLQYVYANTSAKTKKEENEILQQLTYSSAIREGFRYLLANYPEVFVIGQGLWSPWYVGQTMADLEKEFGKQRLIDSPVSELACTGAALGAGLTGYRPIVLHPRMDFMLLAADPIVNQAAKWSSMLGGQVHPAMTIRGIINRGGEQGAQHSQALHALFAHIPGLKVVMPATVADARDLLIASVLSDDPVLYIDDRWLYDLSAEVPPITDLPLAAQGPQILRQGEEVTLVASSYSVQLCLAAAEQLAKHNISAEVCDLRIINPLDVSKVVESVKKTGRLFAVDGSWRNCGLAGEIIASVSEQLPPQAWKSPPQRLTLPAAPAPTSRPLEQDYYFTAEQIVELVRNHLYSAE